MPERPKPTNVTLLEENARLRAQLDEVQQLIDALRRGDVDALMVGNEGERQLLALGDRERGYRQLVEEMNEGALTLNDDGLILYANRKLAQMLGTPLEKLSGSRLDNWLSDESREAMTDFLQSDEGTLSNRRAEFVLKARNGAPMPVMLSFSDLPRENGPPLLVFIITDLSEQKHNEAIVADERLARSILEQATDAIVVCDPSGRVIRANHAVEKLCHCHPLGTSFNQQFALQDNNAKAITLEHLTETVEDTGMELWFSSGDNRRLLQVSTAPINEPDGSLLGHVVTLNDITEIKEAIRQTNEAKKALQEQLDQARRGRMALLSVVEDQKQTEQALRESEAHFRLALASLPITVWNMDRELRYTWFHGHERQERDKTILGKCDSDLYSENDAVYLTRLKQQVLDSGEALSKEVYLTLDGELQFYNYYIEPLQDEQGEITGISGAAVNVTDMRQLEAARKSLSDALKQTASAIAMLDTDLRFEFTNKAFDELFGFQPGETSGKGISVIAPPADAASLSATEIKEQVLQHKLFRGELVRQKKGGELMPVYLTAAPLRGTEGELTGYVASYSDLRPIKESEQRLKGALTDTITAISHTIEKRDPYTAGHQARVAELAVAIADEMGLDRDRIEGIYLGSLIHDIGKIYIPAEILNRPGKLSSNEFGIIKTHPEVGYEIIKDVQFDWPIAEMVYQHHERIDGTGYPQGLKGDDICLEAKIVAVADIVEAMTSHRPYRPGLGLEAALTQIESEAGTKLDKTIVDSCLSLFREKNFNWSSSF